MLLIIETAEADVTVMRALVESLARRLLRNLSRVQVAYEPGGKIRQRHRKLSALYELQYVYVCVNLTVMLATALDILPYGLHADAKQRISLPPVHPTAIKKLSDVSWRVLDQSLSGAPRPNVVSSPTHGHTTNFNAYKHMCPCCDRSGV